MVSDDGAAEGGKHVLSAMSILKPNGTVVSSTMLIMAASTALLIADVSLKMGNLWVPTKLSVAQARWPG